MDGALFAAPEAVEDIQIKSILGGIMEKRIVNCHRSFWGTVSQKEVTEAEFKQCQSVCGCHEEAWDCFDVDGDPLPFHLAGEPAE
jgi:hypothetical protein